MHGLQVLTFKYLSKYYSRFEKKSVAYILKVLFLRTLEEGVKLVLEQPNLQLNRPDVTSRYVNIIFRNTMLF